MKSKALGEEFTRNVAWSENYDFHFLVGQTLTIPVTNFLEISYLECLRALIKLKEDMMQTVS